MTKHGHRGVSAITTTQVFQDSPELGSAISQILFAVHRRFCDSFPSQSCLKLKLNLTSGLFFKKGLQFLIYTNFKLSKFVLKNIFKKLF